MATLLTTTNIIVSGLLRDVKLQGFGLLDFAPIGLPIAFAGILFMVFWGRKFFPKNPLPNESKRDEESGEILLNTYQLNDRLQRGRVKY